MPACPASAWSPATPPIPESVNRRAANWGVTSRSALFAVGVHLLLLAVIGLSFNFAPEMVKPFTGTPAVQATVVTEAELEQEMKRLQDAELERQREEQRREEELEKVREQARELEKQRKEEELRLRKLEQERIAEEQRKAEAEKQRKLEEQKAVELEKQRKAEQERLKKIEQEKQRQEEEQRNKREAEERERQRQEEQRRKEEEALQEAERRKREEAERKQREEAERKQREEEERRRAEEARRAEEERQRQAEEARIQAEMEAKMLREQTEQDAVSALQGMVNQIRQKVIRNWIKPLNVGSGLSVLISVRLTRTGEVISARVAQSSGDERFDDSAVRAVLKASPLPFPNDPKYYEFISTFNFRFKPEG